MSHKHSLLALACTLFAIGIGAAQAEVAVDNSQPPTPSATKARLAPPFTGAAPGAMLSHQEIGTVCMSPSVATIIFNSPGGGLAAALSSSQAAAPDPHGVMMLAGRVEIREYPNDDHFSLPEHCVPDARNWLNGLFSSWSPGVSLP